MANILWLTSVLNISANNTPIFILAVVIFKKMIYLRIKEAIFLSPPPEELIEDNTRTMMREFQYIQGLKAIHLKLYECDLNLYIYPFKQTMATRQSNQVAMAFCSKPECSKVNFSMSQA